MKAIVLAVVLALATGACAKVTYVNPGAVPGPVVEKTGHFFIAGLAGTAVIPAYQMCPGGVAQVQSKFTVGDVLLTIFTFLIYTPRTYEITCSAGGMR